MALDRCRKYNLDCDVVYYRQWCNTSISVTSIQDYLVSTRSVVVIDLLK